MDGLDKLPATLPSRHGASGRLTPRQSLRRRAADALDRPGPARDRRLELRQPGPARSAAPRPRPPLARRGRAREPALHRPVAPAHDPARVAARRRAPQPSPRRRHAAPVRGRRGLPARRRRSAAPRALPRRRAADRRRAPADLARPRSRGRSTSSRPRACWAALLDTLRVPWTVARATEPFLHPGRSATHPGRRPARRLDRRDPPAGGRRVGPERHGGGVRARSRCAWPCRRPRSTARSAAFPDVREDLAVVVPEHVTAAELIDAVRGAGRPLLAGRRGVRRLSRSGKTRRRQRVARAAPHVPRRGPNPHRRGGGRATRRHRRGGRACARREDPCRLACRVFGAAGFTGALTARLLHRHPSFELSALTARSDQGATARRPLPPPPGADRARGARPRPPRRRRRRRRRLPARRRRAARRRSCASAACAWST